MPRPQPIPALCLGLTNSGWYVCFLIKKGSSTGNYLLFPGSEKSPLLNTLYAGPQFLHTVHCVDTLCPHICAQACQCGRGRGCVGPMHGGGGGSLLFKKSFWSSSYTSASCPANMGLIPTVRAPLCTFRFQDDGPAATTFAAQPEQKNGPTPIFQKSRGCSNTAVRRWCLRVAFFFG